MNEPVYATHDPCLASFVRSQGVPVVGAKRLSSKKVEYSFRADRELHALLRLYWRRAQVLLAPADLFDAYREVKGLCQGRT